MPSPPATMSWLPVGEQRKSADNNTPYEHMSQAWPITVCLDGEIICPMIDFKWISSEINDNDSRAKLVNTMHGSASAIYNLSRRYHWGPKLPSSHISGSRGFCVKYIRKISFWKNVRKNIGIHHMVATQTRCPYWWVMWGNEGEDVRKWRSVLQS